MIFFKIKGDALKDKENSKEKVKEIPDPRSASVIQVKFTPRVFPTPSRESQEKNEQDVISIDIILYESLCFNKFQWLQNQMDARKLDKLPEDLGDVSKEEIDLDWLKDKAK